MNYFIYKYVNNNEIVYIGQTINLAERISEHAREPNFQNFNGDIFYFKCGNKTEMQAYEYFLINKYQPIYNIQCKYKLEMTELTEPMWTKYVPKQTRAPSPTENIIDDDEDYITIKEFADLKHISVQAIYKPKSRYQPFIRYSKTSRQKVIHKKALELFNDLSNVNSKQDNKSDDVTKESLQHIIQNQQQEIEFLRALVNNLTMAQK